ncbi:helix-turn-helix domain-containing protein [Litorimonas sp. WD9-15]|uniref:helix-turn-helix domain-containing protein n=1 Tax=Litorimonas sp. WD9-15 TaxID=3418716 RepID=UPI003D081CBF
MTAAWTLPPVAPDFRQMPLHAARIYAAEADFLLRQLDVDADAVRVAAVVTAATVILSERRGPRRQFGPAEGRLLLALSAGHPRTHAQLLHAVGVAANPDDSARLNSLRVHVVRLRHLLRGFDADIMAIVGFGYQLWGRDVLIAAMPCLAPIAPLETKEAL